MRLLIVLSIATLAHSADQIRRRSLGQRATRQADFRDLRMLSVPWTRGARRIGNRCAPAGAEAHRIRRFLALRPPARGSDAAVYEQGGLRSGPGRHLRLLASAAAAAAGERHSAAEQLRRAVRRIVLWVFLGVALLVDAPLFLARAFQRYFKHRAARRSVRLKRQNAANVPLVGDGALRAAPSRFTGLP